MGKVDLSEESIDKRVIGVICRLKEGDTILVKYETSSGDGGKIIFQGKVEKAESRDIGESFKLNYDPLFRYFGVEGIHEKYIGYDQIEAIMNFDFRPLYHKFFPSQDAK
jgi:hypothetical protein